MSVHWNFFFLFFLYKIWGSSKTRVWNKVVTIFYTIFCFDFLFYAASMALLSPRSTNHKCLFIFNACVLTFNVYVLRAPIPYTYINTSQMSEKYKKTHKKWKILAIGHTSTHVHLVPRPSDWTIYGRKFVCLINSNWTAYTLLTLR